ncbi:MAG TPA: AbrB family transcriptional regulator [Clostridiales bacterium]|nr:AbrB family transcriptional regulator [Clostridiales bacterium]
MEAYMNTVLTLFVAVLGGLIGLRLRIPAGSLIGSIVASALFNIISSKGFIPYNFRLVAQMVVGGYIGLSFSRSSLLQIKSTILPLIMMVVGMFVFSILMGLFLHKVAGIDLATAMLGTAPGGITEMSILADSYGADISIVASMHLIRIVSIVIFLPPIIRKILVLLLDH